MDIIGLLVGVKGTITNFFNIFQSFSFNQKRFSGRLLPVLKDSCAILYNPMHLCCPWLCQCPCGNPKFWTDLAFVTKICYPQLTIGQLEITRTLDGIGRSLSKRLNYSYWMHVVISSAYEKRDFSTISLEHSP